MSYGWRFMTCTGERNKNYPQEKEMQKSKMAGWGGLTNSCEKKRTENQRRKGKIYHLNEEFQGIGRRDKKPFLNDQCKEIEENNRTGKTRDHFGEDSGTPLQYSGLENSVDCTVHGITKSQTQLSDFHYFHFAWNAPLVSLIFLKRSLVFPILLFSSISLHWSLRKAFYLSLLFFGTRHSDGYMFSFLLCL